MHKMENKKEKFGFAWYIMRQAQIVLAYKFFAEIFFIQGGGDWVWSYMLNNILDFTVFNLKLFAPQFFFTENVNPSFIATFWPAIHRPTFQQNSYF